MKKGIILTLLFLSSFSILFANGNQEQEEGVTTLRIFHWRNDAANIAIKKLNEKFMAENPDIKIEYSTVPTDGDTFKQTQQTRVMAGDVDIFAHTAALVGAPKSWTPGAEDPKWKQWIDAGLVADLTDQPFVKNYREQSIKEANTYNGKVYGVTVGSVAFTGIFYNKAIFKEYGLEVPKTWNEFVNVMETLKSNGVVPIGFAGRDIWPLNLAVQGLQASIYENQLEFIQGVWEGSKSWTDSKHIEVLEKAQILMNYAIDGFMGIDYTSLPGLFAIEKCAMIGDGAWDAPTIATANPDLEFGYFPIPGNDNAAYNKNLAGKFDMTWFVHQNSPNKAAALKWLNFFSEPGNYAEFVNAVGFMPTQDVEITDPFINSLSEYGFINAYDQLMINPANLGQHIANSSVNAHFLNPAGPIATAEDLAELQQQQWEAAF